MAGRGKGLTEARKLTKAERAALAWLKANEPVSAFPCSGPCTLSMAKRLGKVGLVEHAGFDPGRFGFVSMVVSAAGRVALQEGRDV